MMSHGAGVTGNPAVVATPIVRERIGGQRAGWGA